MRTSKKIEWGRMSRLNDRGEWVAYLVYPQRAVANLPFWASTQIDILFLSTDFLWTVVFGQDELQRGRRLDSPLEGSTVGPGRLLRRTVPVHNGPKIRSADVFIGKSG